ncbi:MAG: adenylyltransferase/cytidyltransferase family protein [archaeon]
MAKKHRVLAFGTFDGLHPGHLHYLEQAKKFGEELTVVIARDTRVKKIKLREPILKENERKKLIQALKPVDKTVLGNKNGAIFEVLKKLKPEVIVLGYDQQPSTEKLREELKKRGIKAEIKRVKALNAGKFKSSKLKNKIIRQMNFS